MEDKPDFHQLLEASPAIPWTADAQTFCFTYVAPEVEQLFGYPQEMWYRPGFWVEHLHPDDRGWAPGFCVDCVEHSRPHDFEYRFIAADGRVVWVHDVVAVIERPDGSKVLNGFFIDITEQRSQAERLRALVHAQETINACNTAMLVANDEQTLLQEVCRIMVETGGFRMAWVGYAGSEPGCRVIPAADFGATEDYLAQADIRWSDTPEGRGPTGTAIRSGEVQVMPHIDTASLYEPWRRAALQRGYRSSVALPLVSGTEVFGALNIYAGEDDAFDASEVELLSRLANNLAYGVLALRDRRQRAVSEQRLQALYDTSPDMIFIHGVDGRLLDVNHNVISQFGYSRSEMLGAELDVLMGETFTSEDAMALIQRAAEGESLDFEWVARRKDGSEFPVDVRLRRLEDSAGGGPKVLALVRDITRQKRAEADIVQRTAQFEAVFNSLTDAAVFADPQRRMAMLNPAVMDMFGYDLDELLGHTTQMLYAASADYEEQGRQRYSAEADALDSPVYEALYKRKDGSTFVGETLGCQVKDPQGTLLGFIGIIRDITERKQVETHMETLSTALDQTADAVSITDPGGIIEYVNPAFEAISGYSRQEALGKPESLVKSGRHDEAYYDAMWRTLNNGEVFRDVLINRRSDGELYYEEKTISPIRDASGAIRHFVATGKDITERMESQERLRYLAHHDVLTGLPNRTLFLDRLDHALSKRAVDGRLVSLLFLDLDRFKLINDTLGHDAGDRLLCMLSDRLRACVRQGDTIARLGGDEFGIIMEDLIDGRRAGEVAQQILDGLNRPFDEQDSELFVTGSIGIALAPTDGPDAKALLKHADIAMYRAKESGRNTYQFYSADMSARAEERLGLETQLRYALERDEFQLDYQPQVRLSDGELVGVEALLRWLHPEKGRIMPGEFIPILEETGLIVPVGEWVLRTACRELRDLGEAGQGLRLAVNLSSRQFGGRGLMDMLSTVLSDTGFAADCLEIEITESLILRDDEQTLRMLNEIADMGISIAIDDFGTGYSALSYLKRFPIDTLKIDRSFIRDISSDPDDAAIVQAVIAMARSLDLDVIAEGVESPEQLAFLKGQQCPVAQGYLFSRPGELAEVLRFERGDQ